MKRQLIRVAPVILSFLSIFLIAEFVYAQQPVASFYYDDGGHVTRQARDTNGDGKMDRWSHYNGQGQIERIEQDVNFDGNPDMLVIMRTASPAAKKWLAITTGELICGILSIQMEKSSVKVKIQTERVSRPCGFTIKTVSR